MRSDLLAVGWLGVVGAASGCRDNEQLARAIGAEARDVAAARCAAAKRDAGAGATDEAEAAEAARETCVDGACRAECAKRAVAQGFEPACVAACNERGVCLTDDDCSAGRSCVAVAPVVRRCVAKP